MGEWNPWRESLPAVILLLCVCLCAFPNIAGESVSQPCGEGLQNCDNVMPNIVSSRLESGHLVSTCSKQLGERQYGGAGTGYKRRMLSPTRHALWN